MVGVPFGLKPCIVPVERRVKEHWDNLLSMALLDKLLDKVAATWCLCGVEIAQTSRVVEAEAFTVPGIEVHKPHCSQPCSPHELLRIEVLSRKCFY